MLAPMLPLVVVKDTVPLLIRTAVLGAAVNVIILPPDKMEIPFNAEALLPIITADDWTVGLAISELPELILPLVPKVIADPPDVVG